MSETGYSKFRLGSLTLADLDALAASAGSRTQALREAVAHWRRAVEGAARRNADELSREDWYRLAHLNDPGPLGAPPSGVREEAERAAAPDWSARLAQELLGAWEGRELVPPPHKAEAAECRRLARRIAGWGPARGYALFACLRCFWRHDVAGEWWRPEVWLAPRGADR